MQQFPIEPVMFSSQIMFTSQIRNSSATIQDLAPFTLHRALSRLILNSNFISLWNCLIVAVIALNCPDQIASDLMLIPKFLLNHAICSLLYLI